MSLAKVLREKHAILLYILIAFPGVNLLQDNAT